MTSILKLKKVYISAILLVLSICIWQIFFTYRGDGVYEEYGACIMKTHNLKLPKFSLDEVKEYSYRFKNYNTLNNHVHVNLILESDIPIPFWQLSTFIEVEIEDKKTGEVIFERKSKLNSHYERMLKEKKVSYPNDDEWLAHYEFLDRKMKNKMIPFSIEKEPIKQKNCEYWAMGSSPNIELFREYKVIIKVRTIDSRFNNLIGHIEIGSGAI